MNIEKIFLWMIAVSFTVSSGYCQMPLEYFLPANGQKDQIIRHSAYTLKYNQQNKQADWVIYFLNKARATGAASSDGKFLPDPEIKNGQAQAVDYKSSGYEIGQLVAPGDMKWSKMSLTESYYLSATSPQKAAFKKGLLNALEKKIRTWAEENEEIYVVSGPVLEKDLSYIGVNKIAAPKYFFKVILDIKDPDMKGIGFILPNGTSNKPLEKYAVSIDAVEETTGINFFPNIPDELENSLESAVDISKWFGESVAAGSAGGNSASGAAMRKPVSSSSSQMKPQTKSGKVYSPAVMCLGVTKEGKRCPRMTTNENGFCWEHQDQAKQSQDK